MFFRGTLASNHINFFTRESLTLTVERAGWKIIEARPFVTSIVWLDTFLGFISPHIYVVAANNVSFRYPEKKYKEWHNEADYKEFFTITEGTK